jgi:hypothetical protein
MRPKSGLDFTNMFKPSFYDPRSQKRKKYNQVFSVFFALLGSMPAKAACETLVKLTQITLCFKVLNANYRIILI